MYKNDNDYNGYEFKAKSKRQFGITKNQSKNNANDEHADYYEVGDARELKNKRVEKQMQELKRILRIMSNHSSKGVSKHFN